jgi:hypothetical protein
LKPEQHRDGKKETWRRGMVRKKRGSQGMARVQKAKKLNGGKDDGLRGKDSGSKKGDPKKKGFHSEAKTRAHVPILVENAPER